MHRTYVCRRRVTLTVLVITGGLVSGSVADAVGRRGSDDALAPVSRRTYVVRNGDTLWSIASGLSSGGDPRPLVDGLESENDVAAGDLVPGMTLSIPAP